MSADPAPAPASSSSSVSTFLLSHPSLAPLFSSESSTFLLPPLAFPLSPSVEASVCEFFTSRGDYPPLITFYKRLLSFDVDDISCWLRLACFLSSSCLFSEAFQACQQILRRKPENLEALVLAGKLCLNHLGRSKDAVLFSTRALSVLLGGSVVTATLASELHGLNRKEKIQQEEKLAQPPVDSISPLISPSISSPLVCVSLLFSLAGSSYSYQAATFSNRKQLQKRSLTALLQLGSAIEDESAGCGEVFLALALLHADIFDFPAALSWVKKAIKSGLSTSEDRAWKLIALILTAQQNFGDARKALDNGILVAREKARGKILEPLNDLMRLRIHLFVQNFHTQREAGQPSSVFLQSLLEALKSSEEFSLFLPSEAFEVAEDSLEDKKIRKIRRKKNSNEKSKQQEKQKIPVAPAEDDENLKQKILVVENLLVLAQLHAKCAQVASEPSAWLDEAEEFIDFAFTVAPARCFPDLFAQRGALAAQRDSPIVAIEFYQLAIAQQNCHVPSLLALGSLLNKQDSADSRLLAEGFLKSALQIDASQPRGWYELGLLKSRCGLAEASQHFLTALELSKNRPIVSFQTIERIFP